MEEKLKEFKQYLENTLENEWLLIEESKAYRDILNMFNLIFENNK